MLSGGKSGGSNFTTRQYNEANIQWNMLYVEQRSQVSITLVPRLSFVSLLPRQFQLKVRKAWCCYRDRWFHQEEQPSLA